jgi:hypothetical protein
MARWLGKQNDLSLSLSLSLLSLPLPLPPLLLVRCVLVRCVRLLWGAIVSARYVLSGARGGTIRAINAFSVGGGFQSSWWLYCRVVAGVNEHVQKTATRDFAYVPACDDLDKVSCAKEHRPHVFDIRDIPTPNILIEDKCETAFNSMPCRDVRDEICVCVCEC